MRGADPLRQKRAHAQQPASRADRRLDPRVKGVGEAGTTASLAAVMNAVADAGANIDMPATPERVWRALSANSRGA